jgi:hypothetical protein
MVNRAVLAAVFESGVFPTHTIHAPDDIYQLINILFCLSTCVSALCHDVSRSRLVDLLAQGCLQARPLLCLCSRRERHYMMYVL